MSGFSATEWHRLSCPDGPHRGPQGPNEDLAQCPTCHMPSWRLRPQGETYGEHLADCSLPLRHPSYCEPGGAGHPLAEKVRGYMPCTLCVDGVHCRSDRTRGFGWCSCHACR